MRTDLCRITLYKSGGSGSDQFQVGTWTDGKPGMIDLCWGPAQRQPAEHLGGVGCPRRHWHCLSGQFSMEKS